MITLKHEVPIIARARSATNSIAQQVRDVALEDSEGIKECSPGRYEGLELVLREAIDALLYGLEVDDRHRTKVASRAAERYTEYDSRSSAILQLHRIVSVTAWRTIVSSARQDEAHWIPVLAERMIYYNYHLHSLVDGETLATQLPSKSFATQESVVDSIVYGTDSPKRVAEKAGIRLASSYVVLTFQLQDIINPSAGRQWRHSFFVEARNKLGKSTLGDVLCSEIDENFFLFLLPVSLGVTGSEAKAVASDACTELAQHRPLVGATAPCPQVSEAPAAVSEALDVLSIVRTLGFSPDVYELDDVLIESALFRAPDLADRLAQRLAPLEGLNEHFIQTLEIYLQQDLNRRRCAQVLHIHPNTLDYRLRRIREVIELSPLVSRDLWVIRGALAAWRISRQGNVPAEGSATR